MFKGLSYFLDLLDVSPIWPIVILVGLIALCFIPHEPVAKIIEKKDKDGNKIITILKYRK